MPDIKGNRAVIYARYSSNNQREESIEAQIRVCRKYAAETGLEVLKEYKDSAISGRTDDRPAFQRMIQDSARNEFDVLLIYAHDRFSRNKYDTATYKARLKKNGVRIIAATLPLDDSPEAGLMESIMEGFAQYYSENLSRSTLRGLEENALHCKSNGSPPYGYTVVDGRYTIDPIPAAAVKIIFDMYVQGASKKAICARLDNEGYRTKSGMRFKINSLQKILKNERYAGVYLYKGHRQEGGMPAIIDRATFDKAQEQIARRRRAPGHNSAQDGDYILSGKVFCGHCGKKLVGECGRSSTGSVYHYYKCSARKKKPGSCDKKADRKEKLEDIVINFLRREVLTDELIDEIAEQEFQLLDAEAQDKSLLEALSGEHKQVSDKIDNLMDAIEAGIFTARTRDRLQELEDRQTELEDKIVREKLKKPEFTKEHIVFWLLKFRAGDFNDPDFRRQLVDTLVNSVYVYDDKEKSEGIRIVLAINVMNGPRNALTRSDAFNLGPQLTQSSNHFAIKKYYAVFAFASTF